MSVRVHILLFIPHLHLTTFLLQFPTLHFFLCFFSLSLCVCICECMRVYFNRNYLSSLSLVVSYFPFPFQRIITQPISAIEERVLSLIIAVKINMCISACCNGTKWDEHSCFSVVLRQPNRILCLNSKPT